MAKANLSGLDRVLPHQAASKNSKRRHVTDHSRNDAVSDALSKCNSASEIGTLAMKFGITEAEVRQRAKSAKNFGLFRMAIGNRLRGITNRIAKAKRKSIKLSVSDAAYPDKAKSKAPAKKTKKAKKKAKR